MSLPVPAFVLLLQAAARVVGRSRVLDGHLQQIQCSLS